MKMKVEVVKEEELDLKYLCADLGVRYWEDGEFNGVDDISYEEQEKGAAPRMPLAVKNENARSKDEQYRWVIKIDLETGNLVGWPKGVVARIHYKVCDDGTYWLEDAEGNKIHEIEDYVPKVFDFVDDSFGDYIIFNVDEDGHITQWYSEGKLNSRIRKFLETEGF